MGLLVSDADLAKVQRATTEVIEDAISHIATVLVPAVASALGGINASITVTIPPIEIGPIKIEIGAKE